MRESTCRGRAKTTYLYPRNSHESEKFLAFVVMFFRNLDLTTRELVDILGGTYRSGGRTRSAKRFKVNELGKESTHQLPSLQLRLPWLLDDSRNAS